MLFVIISDITIAILFKNMFYIAISTSSGLCISGIVILIILLKSLKITSHIKYIIKISFFLFLGILSIVLTTLLLNHVGSIYLDIRVIAVCIFTLIILILSIINFFKFWNSTT